MRYASTEANTNRSITKGNGRPLTNSEKIDDAMNTSQRHMKNYLELSENILELEIENV